MPTSPGFGASKPSHLDGYNKGYYLNSGNSAELTQIDPQGVIYIQGGRWAGGAGTPAPWVKAYCYAPDGQPIQASFVTNPAVPTGIGAMCFGLVNGVPTYVALTNSVTTTGGIIYSTDHGKTWTAANLGSAPGGAWVDITFGNGRFVAVASALTTSTAIAYSPDGINWTYATTTAPAGNWNAVSFGRAGSAAIGGTGLFVATSAATSTSASIATSPDGATWTFKTTPTPAGNWSAVAYGNVSGFSTGYTTNTTGYAKGTTVIPLITGTGSILVGDQIQISGDPNTYTVTVGITAPGSITISGGLLQAIPAGRNFGVNIVGGSPGFVFTALGTTTNTTMYYTKDGGTTFTAVTLPAAPLTTGLVTVSYSAVENMWVALASTVTTTAGCAYYSRFGSSWSTTTLPSAPAAVWKKVQYLNGNFLAICGSTSVTASTMYSDDGISWQYVTLPSAPGGVLNCLTCGDVHSGVFLIGANAATTTTAILRGLLPSMMLIETSGGGQPEGTPDFWLVRNSKSNPVPDVSRVY